MVLAFMAGSGCCCPCMVQHASTWSSMLLLPGVRACVCCNLLGQFCSLTAVLNGENVCVMCNQ